MGTLPYSAFMHFAVACVLLCLAQCEGKFVEIPKEEITPPPVTASTNGWRPLLPTTEKVSIPAATAIRGGYYRQTTIIPYVTTHPVLGKFHAHMETAQKLHHQRQAPHAKRVEIYSQTPPSILGSFSVFGHAAVKTRDMHKNLDSDTSETRLTAAGPLIPPPGPQTISLTRFPDPNFKFNFDTTDKQQPTYYIQAKDTAFQFLSPPKSDKYYYTSLGEFPSQGGSYSTLGAAPILAPLPQSQYFQHVSSGSISHTSTKFGDSDVVKFYPQSTDIQVSGGGTPSPQQIYVHPGRVQDVPLHSSQPQDAQTISLYQRKKNNPQYETTTMPVPKWSPHDPYRTKVTHESTGFNMNGADNVGTALSHLLDGRILPGSTPLTFEKEQPLLTTLPPQELPKKLYYPTAATQQTSSQFPTLRTTAEKLRIARPYFDQERIENKNQRIPQFDVAPTGKDSLQTSANENPELQTTRKPLKPLLPTPLTEEYEQEEEGGAIHSQLEEGQNEIRTHQPRRPTVRPRLPPTAFEENEKPRPYRPRRPVTRKPVTDSYEEDAGSRLRTPTATERERWRPNSNRPERTRNRNRYGDHQADTEPLKKKRRRRPTYVPEYSEEELTTLPADYQFSAVGNEDVLTTSTTPVYADYRMPNRGRERHRNRLPPVHRRVISKDRNAPLRSTPPTAPAAEPWESDDYIYEQDASSKSTSTNIFDEPHTLNEIDEADEYMSTKIPTTSTTTTTTTTPTTTATPEPTTTTSTTTTESPTTTSAALRLRNRFRYRTNSTRPRFSVKDYKERLTRLSSIANSNPNEEPDTGTAQEYEGTGAEEVTDVQESVKTSDNDDEPSGAFDIIKTEDTTKTNRTEIASPSALASTRIRIRGSHYYGSTSTTTTTTTEPTTRSRYRQREHSRYNPSLRNRYSTTPSSTTTDTPATVSTSTERINLFKPIINRNYRPGSKYHNRYRSSTEAPIASNDEEPTNTRTRNYTAARKPYPLRSRYSARTSSSTEKPEDTVSADSDVFPQVTEVTSSDALKTLTNKDNAVPIMSEKIDTTTSESQEILDDDWSTTLSLFGGSVSTTTSAMDSNSIVLSSVTELPTFAPAYHDDQEDLSQRIADLTSSASSAGYFKTMAPPKRTNLRITMATDDPILPIEAFFPIRSKSDDMS